MNLIPVLDLRAGQVVHALRGDRQAYRPVVSRLCAGSAPDTVAQALCDHSGSRTLYIADLDALLGGPVQAAVLAGLLQALPGVTLWVDAGFADAAQARALQQHLGPDAARLRPVFASESLRSRDALRDCFAAAPPGLLSLDRRAGRTMDPAGCWEAPALWPPQVIAMTLEQVGADAGPDLRTLAGLRARSPSTAFIGAGGIRDAADLARAEAAGAQGWLVASALHAGRLPRRGAARNAT